MMMMMVMTIIIIIIIIIATFLRTFTAEFHLLPDIPKLLFPLYTHTPPLSVFVYVIFVCLVFGKTSELLI